MGCHQQKNFAGEEEPRQQTHGVSVWRRTTEASGANLEKKWLEGMMPRGVEDCPRTGAHPRGDVNATSEVIYTASSNDRHAGLVTDSSPRHR